MTQLSRRRLLAAGATVVALSALSTVGIAAATGGFTRQGAQVASACTTPVLPGAVVTVTLADVRSMMGNGSGSMMGGGSLMGQHDWPRFRHGMMSLAAAPAAVTAGTVSLRVSNTGYLTHELVVLPLAAGQQPGQRVALADGKVPETGSMGEASATCAAGAGAGIAAGSKGWVSVPLIPGRYELVCNLPGHYGAGMYTELDVR